MKASKTTNKVTANNETTNTTSSNYAASFNLVWAIIAYLYFISTPKAVVGIIFSLVPTLSKSVENFDSKGLLYKICTVANAIMLFVLVAMQFNLIPYWEPIKYFAVFGALSNLFGVVENRHNHKG